MGRHCICLIHFVKSALWITVLIVRVGCIIEAYAPAGELSDAKHSFEKQVVLQPSKRKPARRFIAARDLSPSSEDASPVDIDDSCTGKKDKYYPNYSSDCTSYYFCAAGYQITYVCKPGSRYNGEKCLDDYKCPVSPEKRPLNPCAQSPNGYYTDIRNAQKYYYCYHGAKVIELSCDYGKVYDGNERKCLRAEEVEEGRQRWRDSSCADGKKGFYPDLGSGCTKYYYCIGEVKTELECPLGALFNGDVCVQESSSTFKCPSVAGQTTSTSMPKSDDLSTSTPRPGSSGVS